MPKSPLRRRTAGTTIRHPARAPGSSADVRSSSGSRVVVRNPSKRSSAAMVRPPRVLWPDASTEGYEQKRQFRRRIAMREASADRAPVSDRSMSDPPDRVGDERVGGAQDRRPLSSAMPCHGSDPHAVSVGDPLEFGHPIDVYEMRGASQPKIQQRHEALAPGKNLRLVTELGESARGLVNRATTWCSNGGGFTGTSPADQCSHPVGRLIPGRAVTTLARFLAVSTAPTSTCLPARSR